MTAARHQRTLVGTAGVHHINLRRATPTGNVSNLTPGLGIPARRDIDAFSGARQAAGVRAVEVRDVYLHRAVVTDRRAKGELAARRDGRACRRRVEMRAADQATIRRAP